MGRLQNWAPASLVRFAGQGLYLVIWVVGFGAAAGPLWAALYAVVLAGALTGLALLAKRRLPRTHALELSALVAFSSVWAIGPAVAWFGGEGERLVAAAMLFIASAWALVAHRREPLRVLAALAPFFALVVVGSVAATFDGMPILLLALPLMGLFSTTVFMLGRGEEHHALRKEAEQTDLIAELSRTKMENEAITSRLELALNIANGVVYEVRPREEKVIGAEALTRSMGRKMGWDELINMSRWCPEEEMQRITPMLMEAQSSRKDFELEHKYIHGDGSHRWVHSWFKSFFAEDGQIERQLVFSIDVTSRRALEVQFEEALKRAEAIVVSKGQLLDAILHDLNVTKPIASEAAASEREASVVDMQYGKDFAGMTQRLSRIIAETESRDTALGEAVELLQSARRAADAANIAKSQFLDIMSHELRTPLNAIIGYTELIAESLEDAGMDDFLKDAERVRAAALSQLELVNSVLDFSSIETGRMELNFEAVDIAKCVQEVADALASFMKAKRLAFDVDIDQSLGNLVTDPLKFKKCLTHLLSNACKFTRDGGVRLKCWRDGAAAAFEVIDTGIGIAPDQQKKVFEPFQQADTTATRNFDGAGLGLAVTRKLARLIGGDVTVESAPGRGSVFTLRIPTHSVPPAENMARQCA